MTARHTTVSLKFIISVVEVIFNSSEIVFDIGKVHSSDKVPLVKRINSPLKVG